MKFHPIANLFPMMTDSELMQLSRDIKEQGLQQSIVVHEEQILDGRNRFKACEMAGVKPHFEKFNGGGSPIAFVVSANLHRRHLKVGQRAAVAVNVLPLLEEEARKRAVKAGEIGGRSKGKEKLPDPSKGQSRDQAGALLGVSGKYVSDAKAIKEKAPESFKQIESGEKSISEVKREMRKAAMVERVAAVPSGKFRVIYADPPWKYGSTFETSDDLSGLAAENNYPTLSIAELRALPIPEMVDDDAVLFLWVTSPLLAECWPVIKAWGFTYKSSYVWDKGRGMPGNYNHVRHEFLLICTRGSCTPDVKDRPPSVQSVKRTGKHSEKPEHFRELIDKLYPHGKRVELFARKKVKGWEAWGNEV